MLQKKCITLKYFVLLMAFMAGILCSGSAVQAASALPARMKSVTITAADKVTVKVTVSKKVSSKDNYYYLFSLTSPSKNIASGAAPLAKAKKKSSVTFQTALHKNEKNSVLYDKFVAAVKTGSKSYRIISDSRFITNPEYLASYNYAFPTASTKKGLQLNPNYLADAKKLGVKHTLVNWLINSTIATKSMSNERDSFRYSYKGKTYWFNRGYVQSQEAILKEMQKQGVVVSVAFLLQYRNDLTYLIPKAGRKSGHAYYGLDTGSAAARDTLQAMFSFLAERYASNGMIANWVIGNEVNNQSVYNYTGSSSLTANAKSYAAVFRLVNTAVRSVYKKARVYVSLDHVWTYNEIPGTHPAKSFLKSFADELKDSGNIRFHIAYHAYPSPITSPEFWKNGTKLLNNTYDSPVINMGNIAMLTGYVKKTWGKDTRIILSEQGFTSFSNGKDVEKSQAAAIAYGYYLAEFNDGIDSFIVSRQIDNGSENAQGLHMGLWTTSSSTAEVPKKKKYSYDVFRLMDTKSGAAKTKFALDIIGAKTWKAIVPGYKTSRFK